MRIPLRDLERAVAEQAALRGAFIENVYQCGPRTFLLKLDREKRLLLLDCAPGRACVLVTDEPPSIPASPPVFGAILRRALRGGRIAGISLPQRDRVVALDCEADGMRRIVVEAFSRHANLLLLDREGRVERVLDGEAARHRGNPVGARYTLPPPPAIPEESSLLPPDLEEHAFAVNFALARQLREEAERTDAEDAARLAERLLARLRKSRAAAARDRHGLADPARLRASGELLLTHYAALRKGMKRFMGVDLDPRLSPQENVERIFERARKAARAEPALLRRIEELDRLIARVEAGESVPAAYEPRRRGRPQPARKPYRVFCSADGRRILVGKGGRDNDETTLQIAGPHDLFLHVRGTPGAHVIIPLKREEAVPEQTLLDAATLAVHYSKQRSAKAADVTYTRCKHVSKPKGAKPGLVRVLREKVLRLRREPDRLARLLMSAGTGETPE